MSNPLITEEVMFDLRRTLRILIATDGAINLWETPPEPFGENNGGFTLREMARAPWDAPQSTYPYTAFVVDHAIHGAGNPSQDTRCPMGGGALVKL